MEQRHRFQMLIQRVPREQSVIAKETTLGACGVKSGKKLSILVCWETRVSRAFLKEGATSTVQPAIECNRAH